MSVTEELKKLRPEVISAEHTPPPEVIKDFLDQRVKDAKTKDDEPEVVRVRKDQLAAAIRSQVPVHVDIERIRGAVEQMAEEEQIVEDGRKKAKKIKPKNEREQAELHATYPDLFDDPYAIPEIIESSNVDTAGQREEIARMRAEPLRELAAKDLEGRAETGSQHGGPQAEPFDAEAHAKDEAKKDAKAEKEAASAARKAYHKLSKDKKTLPKYRADAPDTHNGPEDVANSKEMYDHLVTYYSPSNGLSIGALVARQDQAHDALGVVVGLDRTNLNHPLANVEWPDGSNDWHAPGNLRYEGMVHDVADD